MKVSKILMTAAMLGSMMLASCGGPEAEQSATETSVAGSKASSSKVSSSKFSAIWSKDASLHVEPTCDAEGKDVEVCINSSAPNKETVLPKKAHTWGTKSAASATPKPSSSML